MFNKSSVFFLLAETSLHAGSGVDVGYVDLPIQRNKANNFPIIQPSEVKGSIREFFEKKGEDTAKINEVFGPENGAEFASAVSFSEARVLFFPVKSLYGVFSYITCPLVLNQFLKDAEIKIPEDEANNFLFNQIGDGNILIINDSIIKFEDEVILNDYPFKVSENTSIPRIEINGERKDVFEYLKEKLFPSDAGYSYWKDNFIKRASIVSDNTFTIITEIATEIITRNKIGEGGVVGGKGGGLWNEENLPQETILYSIVYASKPYKSGKTNFEDSDAVLNFIKEGINNKRIRIGGHKTIGRGFVYIRFLE
ncbi:MAG: type III-B CRISPR module RAMP protein Cmr4 [archaeon]